MGVKLAAASGGSIELVPTNTASSFTVTVPAATGTVVVQGANSAVNSGTAVASTSGTSIDFTSIPSWVKRITVMFNGVSVSGTSNFLVQIGSGSVTTTGYVSSGATMASGGNGATSSTAGFVIFSGTAASILSGTLQICLIDSNKYVSFHSAKLLTTNSNVGGGDVTLSGTLDRVRITTVNGTDTFDAGSINILYE
jgi:hypothetical protein